MTPTAMATTEPDTARRRRVVAFQRWVLNPPMKVLVWFGLVPGHILIETEGRRTAKARRTVVGGHWADEALWVIAEQGRGAAWVRNLEAEPGVRVRHHLRWRSFRASVMDGDDPRKRVATWDRPGHARLVERFGTQLTTIRLDPQTQP